MIHVLAIGSVLASMMGAPLLAEEVSPPEDKVIVDLVTVNGTGCPAGTASIAVSDDNTAFTVTYSDYLAMVGVGASFTDFRKNCQLSVQVHVPSGFTYAIAEVDYRGYAYLEAGATGIEKASYYFAGMSQTASVAHAFVGPYDDNWQTKDTADLIAASYLPCGEQRNLNINTELRVNGGSSDTSKTTSFMTMDSTDTDISTVYHFSWMECSTS